MRTLITADAPPEPKGYVPLARAAICLDCEVFFLVGPTCPNCASEHFQPVATWLFSALGGPQPVPRVGDRPRKVYADGSGYEILG